MKSGNGNIYLSTFFWYKVTLQYNFLVKVFLHIDILYNLLAELYLMNMCKLL